MAWYRDNCQDGNCNQPLTMLIPGGNGRAPGTRSEEPTDQREGNSTDIESVGIVNVEAPRIDETGQISGPNDVFVSKHAIGHMFARSDGTIRAHPSVRIAKVLQG